MKLQNNLHKEAIAMGAAYFGIADLQLTEQGPTTPYEQKLVSEYSCAISVGVPIAKSVVDRIGDQSDHFALRNYGFHIYQVINPLIDQITACLSFALMNDGYSAMPIPASQTLDDKNLYGLFSNKMAASLSGLGWIGKSCLLITRDKGPRVRWGTILTNAPLEPGKPVKTKCGKCTECVESCPAGAFTGRNFVPTEGREMRMIASRCNDFLTERYTNIGSAICGMCVYICPWGTSKEGKDSATALHGLGLRSK